MPKKVPKNPSSRKLPTSNQGLQRDFIAAGTNIRAVDDDKENRTFDLSFSSEEPCQQWFGVEILDHDPAAVDMSRMQDVGVLLYNHNRDKVIGTILRAWIENGRGMATVKFDDCLLYTSDAADEEDSGGLGGRRNIKKKRKRKKKE